MEILLFLLLLYVIVCSITGQPIITINHNHYHYDDSEYCPEDCDCEECCAYHGEDQEDLR